MDFHFDLVDVDAREVVNEAALVWQDRCAREQVELRSEVPEQPVMVRVDAWRLRQIIDNLAENALRVSPEGSTIVLALHADTALAGGHFAVVEVRDQGPGLSDDDRRVAFEPGALHERFRGVRPVGTGLGLALVARLASGMGGSATVTSNPTGGTSFWVRVPRVPDVVQ